MFTLTQTDTGGPYPWTVSDGRYFFRAMSEAQGRWLCMALNAKPETFGKANGWVSERD